MPDDPRPLAITPALLTREESIELVARLLGGAITPTVFWLHDDTYEARLTVDSEIAYAALQAREADRA